MMVRKEPAQISASGQKTQLCPKEPPIEALLFILAEVVTNKPQNLRHVSFLGMRLSCPFMKIDLDRNRHSRTWAGESRTWQEDLSILFLRCVWSQPYSEACVPLSLWVRNSTESGNHSFSTVYNLDRFVRNLKWILSAAISRELREIFV